MNRRRIVRPSHRNAMNGGGGRGGRGGEGLLKAGDCLQGVNNFGDAVTVMSISLRVG